MNLSNLKPAVGSTKNEKRIGRGEGSTRGGTSTRGHKGAKSRSGYKRKSGFEGGQMPLQRRVPKFGFTNINRVEYHAVNLSDLRKFAANSAVDLAALVDAGLLKNAREHVKVLGNGEIDRPLQVTAHRFSASARQKIEAAGGSCNALEHDSGAA